MQVDNGSFGAITKHMEDGLSLINTMFAIRVRIVPITAQISGREAPMGNLPGKATNPL